MKSNDMQWKGFSPIWIAFWLFGAMGCTGPKSLRTISEDFVLATDGSNTTLVAGSSEIKFINSPLNYMFNTAGRGQASSIDLFDPLKPVVYFARQKKLLIFDNTLSLQSEIDLIQNGHENAALVCRSFSGHYWIYDENLNEIIRCDGFFKPVARTGNLGMYYKVNSFAKIKENGNSLFALAPGKGIYIFDLFAKFQRFIPMPEIVSFDVWDDLILALQKSGYVTAVSFDGLNEFVYFEQVFPGASGVGILKETIAIGTGGEVSFKSRH